MNFFFKIQRSEAQAFIFHLAKLEIDTLFRKVMLPLIHHNLCHFLLSYVEATPYTTEAITLML